MNAMTGPVASGATRSDLLRLIVIMVAIVLLAIAAAVTTPTFATVDNVLVIIRAASITGIVAVGLSFVTISGNLFALSAGQMAALFGIVFALLLSSGTGLVVAALATIALAVVAGVLQGSVIAIIGNPIVTTIAFGAVFAGIAALLSGNTLIRVHDTAPLWFGTARPLGIPMQSWTFVVIALVGWFVIRKTRVGRLMTLSGENREAAIASGLRIDLATNLALVIFSVGTAIVAIFSVAQFSLAKADQYSGLDIDSIASVLVGGIALRGGQGSPAQAAFGAVLIAILQNFMLLRSLPTGVRFAIVGAVVVIATAAFHLTQRNRT